MGSSGQEYNNRSQGQRIRRTNERQGDVIDVVISHDERIEALERDSKMVKSRLTSVEQRVNR